jgi:hypothetical protein
LTWSGARALGLAAGLCALPLQAQGPAFTVRGTVVLAPTCSGPDLEAPGCSQRYADAPLEVHDATGARLVTQLRTAADGGFSLSLPAGRYRLGVKTAKVTRCVVLDVDLPAMQGQHLKIDCDTGRR